MACSCSTSSSNTFIPRRYMRIDGLIFDKKYISKLDFQGDKLTLYRKGDCHPFCYKMWDVKSNVQIAEYLLELNTCDDNQVDMSTDDHSKLINLDLDGQHPITAIVGLREDLDNKDTLLQEEVTRATTKDEELEFNLNKEIQDREESDTIISNNLDSEISSRIEKDSELSSALSLETNDRKQADLSINNNISSINSKLNEKMDKIVRYSSLPSASSNAYKFIYTNDGKLLFSNGVTWKRVLLGDL